MNIEALKQGRTAVDALPYPSTGADYALIIGREDILGFISKRVTDQKEHAG